MLLDFTKHMAELPKHNVYSLQTIEAMNYVRRHYTDDINVESALKTYGSKAVLQLRKIYIICRTYKLWNNFKNEDKKNSFIGFYKTLSNDLIKMNLPQLDYLDDFDRGIILATAYRLHNNTTKSLGDLIDEIVKK